VARRLYAHLAPFPDEPTTDEVAVTFVSDAIGEAVVASRRFAPGELIARFTGRERPEVALHSLQIAPARHLDDPHFVGKLAHSCDPNGVVDVAARALRARRVIRPGDLVTIDYEHTEDRLFRSFACACGAAACRHRITGRACG
jgi:uncharacterized protein